MMQVIAATVAFLVTAGLLWILLRSKLSKAIQDVPNARSLHATPTPRMGGIGLLAGMAVGWLFAAEALRWWLLLPLLGLASISLLDDMKGMGVRVRLTTQFAAAVVLLSGAGWWEGLGWLHSGIMVFLIIWMTNLYNFMDGSDGLAGGMAMFGFLFSGVAAMQSGHESLATMCFVVSAAAAGFLIFNFPPAKVFMGDVGSIPLGFLVAATGMLGWQLGSWQWWFPLLVFSPFLMDATVTLIRRSLRGARITEAHREHYYQRAVQLGYGHLKVAVFANILMAAAGISAVTLDKYANVLLMSWLCIYASIMIAIDMKWWRHKAAEL
jgi:UDP-N-acetylmuramyl pentapeptide phosphotransferase/UDP-N-acetylglucosamine-1-phosphate transferase